MPIGFESGLGSISSAFGLDKQNISPVYVDKGMQYSNDLLRQALAGLRTKNAGDQAAYESAFAAATPQANSQSASNLAAINKLLQDYTTYDPLASYERIRSGNLSALGDWAKNLASYGSSADKLAMAARGYGGRASDGTYGSILRQDRISRNIAPVISTIFGNLGYDTATAASNRYNNLLASLGLMNAGTAAVNEPATRLLTPISARLGTFGGETGALANLIANAKANTAGYQSETSNWDRALRGLGSSLDQAGDTYMQLYGLGGMSGGGGIGGIGNMFGVGGGRNSTPLSYGTSTTAGSNLDPYLQLLLTKQVNNAAGY